MIFNIKKLVLTQINIDVNICDYSQLTSPSARLPLKNYHSPSLLFLP